MKKILTLTGLVAMLGLFNAYAGSPAATDAAKPSSDSPPAASCPKGMACSQGTTNSPAASCPKGMTCPKTGKTDAACPTPKGGKGGARTCPVTGATGKTEKAAAASEKPADKDAK